MRNPVFDMMKFAAIMAMIVGHCVHDWRQTIVYCWHMPLFFFVGGYFFKPSAITSAIKYNAKRLLIPYLICSVIAILFICGNNIFSPNTNITKLITPLFFGGGQFLGNYYIYQIWFFVALFICSIIYTIINNYTSNNLHRTIIVVIISTIGYCLGQYYTTDIPFLIPQACIATIFFHVGYLYKEYNSITPKSHSFVWWFFSIIFVSWSFSIGAIDVLIDKYPLFPINILGALGGTFVVMQLCFYASSIAPKISKKIAFLGSLSILIFSVHFIEHTFGISKYITSKLLFFIDNYKETTFEKILFALIVSLLLYQIPIVRRMFRLSKSPQYTDIKASKS